MPKGYTNKEEIENYMLIEIDPSFDTQIDRWIETAEQMIDDYTGRDFGTLEDEDDPTEASDRLFDGNCSSTLYVGAFTGLVYVKLDPDGDEIEPEDVIQYPANQEQKNKIVLQGDTFPEGNQNIVVNAIWSAASIKADIRFCATALVSSMIDFAFSGGSKVSSLTIGRYSVTYKTVEQKNDLLQAQSIMDANKHYTF